MYASEMAKSMSASADVQRGYESEGLSSARQVRPTASLPNLISQAGELQMYAGDRANNLDALAGRALDIATRLTGSFPAPAPAGTAMNGEKAMEPASALDTLQITIGAIRRPLSVMDDGFHRLAAALDAIERALN